jgi:hypothetical protein
MLEILLEVDLHDPVRDSNAVKPELIISFNSVANFFGRRVPFDITHRARRISADRGDSTFRNLKARSHICGTPLKRYVRSITVHHDQYADGQFKTNQTTRISLTHLTLTIGKR